MIYWDTKTEEDSRFQRLYPNLQQIDDRTSPLLKYFNSMDR